MEELLASQNKKLITLRRGQEVMGEVVAITDKELILDLGAKSEGVLPKRDLESAKIGDKIKVFIVQSENDSGQVVLSLQPQMKSSFSSSGKGDRRGTNWMKFVSAQNQKTKLQATVLELNKGGLIVETDGTRGFLPNSQVGFELISKLGEGLDKLIGQTLGLTVIEVDSDNNKLIFTQRGQVSEEVKTKLKEFKSGQKVKGKIMAILPFGLVVDVASVEGLVFISDASWEKVDDLAKIFSVGQELEVVVLGIDESFGRLNLSVKQLQDDPFSVLTEKYPADEVVKAEVVSVSDAGVVFKLEESIEGLLPASKMESGVNYEVGQSMNILIDSVDARKRQINLAPFVTSTEGLIYK